MRKFLIYLSLVMAMVLFSFSFVWYKQVYVYYTPLITMFFRLLISSLFLFLYAITLKKFKKVDKKDYKAFLLLALFEPLIYFIGESFGMNLVSATVGSVIISTIPIFTPVLAFYMFKERLSKTNIFGIILSFFGVLLVVLKDDFSFSASPGGVLLMFLAVAGAMGYSVQIIKLTKRYNSMTIITVQNAIGAVYFLPLLLIFDFHQLENIHISWQSLLPLFELAIFSSTFAYIFFLFGVRNLGITTANMFTNIIPVFTAIFAFFVLDESLIVRKIIGIAVVVTGLFLSQIKNNKFIKRYFFLRK
ncbi:MAG: EamA/RhaT family transporter [Bacteroidetes bacterium]|nr:MAG: EamA/RhaT family transporter [Bacteroidota bacterium]